MILDIHPLGELPYRFSRINSEVSIRNRIVGAIILNYQVIIIMLFKVQYNMISFTSRLLESNCVNKYELAINNGANKLVGPNFLDLLKKLRIVLKRGRLAYVLVEPHPQYLVAYAFERVKRAYQKSLVDSARAGLIILTSKSPKLQKQYKTMDAYSIVCQGNSIMSRQELKGSKSPNCILAQIWRRGHPSAACTKDI